MSGGKPSYEELAQRLARAEAALEALRRGEVDQVIGSDGPLSVRLQSLVEENERLAREWQTTFDGVKDAILLLDGDLRIRRANHAAEGMFQRPAEAMLGRHCWEVVHGAQGPIPGCPLLRTGRRPRRERNEIQIGERFFEETADPLLDATGALTGAIHIVSDITERKRAEEQLRESEERYRVLAEAAQDLIVLVTPQGEIQYTNRFAAAQLDTVPEDLIGKNMADLFPPEIAARQRSNLQKVVQSGEALYVEALYVFPRRTMWLGTRLAPILDEKGKVDAILVISRDITERKRAEEELAKSEARYRLISSVAADYMFSTSLQDGKLVLNWVAGAFESIAGCSMEEYVARGGWRAHLHPDDLAQDDRDMEQLRAGQRVVTEVRTITKGGETRWVRVHAHPVLDEEKKLTGIYGTVEDITERKRAEEALRESENRNRVIAEMISDYAYIFRVTPEGELVGEWVTESFLQRFGYTLDAIDARGGWQSLVYPPDLEIARAHARKVASGEVDTCEMRWVTASGEIRWLRDYAKPVRDETGTRVVRIYGASQDITERKRAEEALRASEETYRNLFHNAQVGLFRTRIEDGKILESNEQLARMFGYSNREEFIAEYVTSRNYVDPGTRERMLELLRRDGFIENFEARFYRKDRAIFWARYSARIYPEHGWIEGVAEDVTEWREAEEKLRQSEERYRLLAETTPDVIILHDLDGRVQYVNRAGLELAGITEAEVIGKPITDFVSSESLAAMEERRRRRTRGNGGLFVYEAEFFDRQGRRHIMEAYSAPITRDGRVEQVLVVARDISDRRRAEEALRESEARFRRLAEHAQDLIYRYEFVPQRGFTYVSPAATAITGFTPEEHYADPDLSFKLVHPDDRHLLEAAAQGSAPFDKPLLLRWIRKDGSLVWTEQRNVPIYDEHGRLVAIEGIARDMTARVQVEEELRRLRELYESIVQDVTEGLVLTDAEGRITFANRALAAMLGYGEEELVGRPWLAFVPAEHQAAAREADARRAAGESHRYELELERRDGRRVAVLVGGRPRFEPATGRFAGTLAVVSDLTERKRAEEERARLQEQLLQAQKLESIGRLAGGVAHDFNNMLNVIMGYADLMLYQLHKDDPMRKKAEEILKAARRSAALTGQLLAFSRKQALQPQVLDLNEHLRNLEKMLRRLIGEDIELSLTLADGLPSVLFDPGQLDQVVINLAVNARDAMPTGGRLLLETALVERDESYAATHPGMEAGSYVLLAITDTGCGMDRQTLARVFEPFFTTKERGKGTGLGLSTVYGIVKQSHGHIWAYSEPGRGTTFKIYLPPTEARPQAPAAAMPSPAPAGGEHILVVEDDDSLRHLTKGLLERLGYRVSVAANGGEAVLLVEEQGLKPDLVLTDVVMPNMNGKELIDRLRRRQQHLKALFMSGYTDNAIVHHGVLDPGTPFIQKPFTIDELSAKLREVLAGENQ